VKGDLLEQVLLVGVAKSGAEICHQHSSGLRGFFVSTLQVRQLTILYGELAVCGGVGALPGRCSPISPCLAHFMGK